MISSELPVDKIFPSTISKQPARMIKHTPRSVSEGILMAQKSNALFWICLAAVLGSIGAHFYLTGHHYQVNYGMPTDGGLCNINETFNCTDTSTSPYSEIFGISISIFGFLTNFLLLGLLLAFKFPIVSKASQPKLQTPIKLLTLFIFTVSLGMGAISVILLGTICPVCSITYLTSLIALITSWAYLAKGFQLSPYAYKVFGVAAIGIPIFAVFMHHSSMRPYGGTQRLELTKLQMLDWKNAPKKQLIPVSPISMHASKTASVRMVEFADYLCGHCAAAFPIIHGFAKAHPDVDFSFQAFPLDGECNSAIQYSEGTRCMLARVAQCAEPQKKAWQVQKWIFQNQKNFRSKQNIQDELKQNHEKLGLNLEELMSCVDSDETRKIIKAQAQLGSDVGIKGTPSLFINGKKVPSGFSLPLLKKIYSEAQK